MLFLFLLYIHIQLFPTRGSCSADRASINKQNRHFLLFFQFLCLLISRDVERLLMLMLRGRAFRRAADGLFAWTVPPRLRGDDGQREVVSQSWAGAAGANRCECVTVSMSVAELHGNAHVQQLQGVRVYVCLCVCVCVCLCVSSW